MKRKKILSLVLAAAMALSLFTIPANAERICIYFGDGSWQEHWWDENDVCRECGVKRNCNTHGHEFWVYYDFGISGLMDNCIYCNVERTCENSGGHNFIEWVYDEINEWWDTINLDNCLNCGVAWSCEAMWCWFDYSANNYYGACVYCGACAWHDWGLDWLGEVENFFAAIHDRSNFENLICANCDEKFDCKVHDCFWAYKDSSYTGLFCIVCGADNYCEVYGHLWSSGWWGADENSMACITCRLVIPRPTTADALTVLRAVAGLITLTAEQAEQFGIVGTPTTSDALWILQVVAGLA